MIAGRGDCVSVAICDDLQQKQWRLENLTDFSVGKWEPGYDTQRWENSKELHVYVQNVEQGDGDKDHYFSIIGPISVSPPRRIAKTFGESETPKLLASFATIIQPVNGYSNSPRCGFPRRPFLR